MIKSIQSFERNQTYWQQGPTYQFSKQQVPGQKLIVINSSKTYQSHLGFGGAFTEAAAETFYQSSKAQQKQIIEAYFSENGLNYNLGRTVMHSSDFSPVGSRTYIEEHDAELNSFSIDFDDQEIVPFIKEALKLQPNLWLLGSPWSPPAFMKSNQTMYYGGKLKKEYYEAWANYFVKYLQEMKKRGIHIDAVSMQNEPEAEQVWESCHYTAEEELQLAKSVHQALKQAALETKLVIWDHNRDIAAERAHHILKQFGDAIWGVGYHWYVKEDAQNLSVIHDLYPNHHILFTEGCVEFTNTAVNSNPNGKDKWVNAEFYGRNIIKDAQNYSEGFIEWNLLLNEIGGPNHVGNFCEAPIMYDRVQKQVIFNPSYYYIGHFSRHIKIGAKRIHANHTVDDQVFVTAYLNPDGQIVVVAQNQGWIKQFTMAVDGKFVDVSLPARSITTFLIE